MSLLINPANVAAGNISFDINIAGSPRNTDLLDISALRYDFDLVGSEDDTRVAGIQGEMQIRVDDLTSVATSAYDFLKLSIGDYSGVTDLSEAPKANCQMSFKPIGSGVTYKFAFDIDFSGMAFDEKTNSTTLRLIPRRPSANVKQWRENSVANPTPRVNVTVYNGSAYNTVNQNLATVGDFIDTLIREINPTATTNIYDTRTIPNHETKAFPTKTDIKYTSLAPANVLAPFIYGFRIGGADDQIHRLLPKFAGYEGAIFGSAFNVNFYVSRSLNTRNQTLDADDIEDVSLAEGPTGLRQVQMNVSNSGNRRTFVDISEAYFLGNGNGSAAGFPFGSQNVAQRIQDLQLGQTTDILGTGGMIMVGNVALNSNINTNAIPDLLTSSSRGNRTVYLQNVLNVGAREFALTRGVIIKDDGSTNIGARLDVTVLGINKVHPHEVIKFDSSLPGRFQARHFRPSSLEYDLKADKIRITAYEIP
jgi:uncharacterized protein (UPF0218 family)